MFERRHKIQGNVVVGARNHPECHANSINSPLTEANGLPDAGAGIWIAA